jgi:superfamily II DNA or RNA helicase
MVQRLKGKLVLDSVRNDLLLELVCALANADRKVIFLSERVGHLEQLAASFASRNLPQSCSLYIGATKAKDRAKASEADVIFATFALASEGLDIPTLDTLVLATPCSDVTQAVGRILRDSPGKKIPLVVDIVDNGCPAFDRNANSRASYYRRCDYAVRDSIETSNAIDELNELLSR